MFTYLPNIFSSNIPQSKILQAQGYIDNIKFHAPPALPPTTFRDLDNFATWMIQAEGSEMDDLKWMIRDEGSEMKDLR